MLARFCIVAFFVSAAMGADLSGKWSGVIEVYDESSGLVVKTPVKAEFAEKAGVLSGRIGRKEDAEMEPIRNARIAGKSITFEVLSQETKGSMRFSLALDGQRLEGEMRGAIEEGPISGKVRLSRDAT